MQNLVALTRFFEIDLGSKVEVYRLIPGDDDATIVPSGKMVSTGAGFLNHLGVGL